MRIVRRIEISAAGAHSGIIELIFRGCIVVCIGIGKPVLQKDPFIGLNTMVADEGLRRCYCLASSPPPPLNVTPVPVLLSVPSKARTHTVSEPAD